MKSRLNHILVVIIPVMLLITILSSTTIVWAMSSKPVEEGELTETVVDKDGLVAHYTFDESLEDLTGNFRASRVVGNRIDAENSGSITYSKGMRGQAAVFDGKSGIRLADGLITDNTYSVALWVNPKEIKQFTTTFFGAKADNQWISIVPNGPVGDTMLWSGEKWYDAPAHLQIKTNKWAHLAITIDNGEVKVYVNGEEKFSGPSFPDVFTSKDGKFALGVNWWDTPFKGMIDDLRIYDKPISAKKIAKLAEGAPEMEKGDSQFKNVSVHDPSVIKVDDTYYIFGSHLASAKSKDLIKWEQISRYVHDNNPLIPNVTEEMKEGLDWAQTNNFWAPDVIELEDGKYYMYYNMCKGDSPRSALGLAVADNVEGPYKDQGIFLKSGMWGEASENGTIYDATIHPNTVDPDVFYDKEGKLWMVYGSYSGGIFILELDPKTGKPYADQGYGKKLLGGNHSRIEAPYVLYSPESEYYYLFLSYGGLSADGGYNIRVARSKNPDGPYYDAKGQDMIDSHGPKGTFFDDDAISPYGVKLMGNFRFINQKGEPAKGDLGYVSPGHNSAYYNQESGKYYIFFHSRFPNRGEEHEVRVHQMFINDEGWLVVAPHRYSGETIDKYSAKDVIGQYKFINHGDDITAEIKDSVIINLNSDGTISGSIDGKWELSGDYNTKLTIDGVTYDGVFLYQGDEANRENVMTFTAVSHKNIAIWGSKIAN